MNSKKIVITGGPATGKTTIIDYLKSKKYTCFEEVIRKLTTEAKMSGDIIEVHSNPITLVSDSSKFNQRLLNLRFNDYLTSKKINSSLCFFDRGVLDVLAYMSYFEQPIKNGFINICKKCHYDRIFLLPPWESIFIKDDERFETFEQAIDIYKHLKETYIKFGYNIIEVPFGSVGKRVEFILSRI